MPPPFGFGGMPPAPQPPQEPVSPEDALLQAALQQALSRPTAAQPQPAALMGGRGERLAAGILAALDPEGYQTIVLPELQRRQQAQQLGIEQEAAGAHRRIGELTGLAQLQSTLNERDANRAYRAEQLRLQQEAAARAAADQEAQEAATAKENQAILAGFDEGAATFQEIVPAVQSAFSNLKNSGDPHDSAIADVLRAKYAALGERMKKAHANRETLTRKDLEGLKSDFSSLQDDLQGALEKSQSSAATRSGQAITRAGQAATAERAAAGKAIPGGLIERLTDAQTGSAAAAEALDLARRFKKKGMVFYQANLLPEKAMTADQVAFKAQLQRATAKIRKAIFGSALSAQEKSSALGLIPEFGSDYQVIVSGLTQLQQMMEGDSSALLGNLESAGYNVAGFRTGKPRPARPVVGPDGRIEIGDIDDALLEER